MSKSYPRRCARAVRGVLMALVLAPSVARAQRYSAQPLAFPAVGYGVPVSLNDAGLTVLNSATGPGFASAVVTPGSSSLIGPPSGFEFAGQSINRSGQIAGTLRSTGGAPGDRQAAVAAIYGGGSSWRTLPGPSGGGATLAFGINNAGVVAGAWIDPEGYTRAAYWSGDQVTILDTTSPGGSYAMGINDRGTIVGFTSDGLGLLWHTTGGTGTYLAGLPPGYVGRTSLINNQDQVLVPVYARTNDVRWYLWDAGRATEVPALSGVDDAYVTGFNDQGQIVATIDGRAAIYENGTRTDLNTLISPDDGWVLQYAAALNDAGQIAGFGTLNGQPAAFLLTPVPEPSAAALACAFLLPRRPRTDKAG
jgi:hypothetical protein